MKASTIESAPMRIGEAASLVGVEPHVLRHWESAGVITPERDASRYRSYDEEALQRIRMLQGCQSAGMSLEQIRLVLDNTQPGREQVIREQRAEIERRREELRRTGSFLDHVLACRHTLVTRCPQCSEYPGD